jgi:hypothetical protein
LALIVAIGMVVGAIAVRRAIDDDGATTTTSGGPDSSAPAATGKVLCAGDLADVCSRFDNAIVEDPAATVDRLVKGEALGADAWIVTAAWPQIAAERARSKGQLLPFRLPTTAIARTPLSFFVAKASADNVRSKCGTTLDWKCLLSAAASVRLDFEDPSTSTAGLLAVIQQATSLYGSGDFGSNDFRTFDRELAQLKSGRATAPSGDTVFERFSLFTHADVLTGLSAVGNQQLKRAQLQDKLVVAAAGPPIAADVVIALATNTSPVKTADVREAFADAGWDTKDLGPLSALPTPDVMIALQELWKGLR